MFNQNKPLIKITEQHTQVIELLRFMRKKMYTYWDSKFRVEQDGGKIPKFHHFFHFNNINKNKWSIANNFFITLNNCHTHTLSCHPTLSNSVGKCARTCALTTIINVNIEKKVKFPTVDFPPCWSHTRARRGGGQWWWVGQFFCSQTFKWSWEIFLL